MKEAGGLIGFPGWRRSRQQVAPPSLGSDAYPPLMDAPGEYVLEMEDLTGTLCNFFTEEEKGAKTEVGEPDPFAPVIQISDLMMKSWADVLSQTVTSPRLPIPWASRCKAF
ncbi:MAG: hypothetical protein H6662_19685 [Ardenticatenaceae bacterium]|nr:hypothetical protein [Ardenticatenaceae bacterium]